MSSWASWMSQSQDRLSKRGVDKASLLWVHLHLVPLNLGSFPQGGCVCSASICVCVTLGSLGVVT